LGSLSGVSVNELYSSALFSEADDDDGLGYGKDNDVEVYGMVPDYVLKIVQFNI